MEIRDEIRERIETMMRLQTGDSDPILIIIGSEYCPNCGLFTDFYKDEIDSGVVKYWDMYEESGFPEKLCERFSINETPSVVIFDPATDTYWKADWTSYLDGDNGTVIDILCEFNEGVKADEL